MKSGQRLAGLGTIIVLGLVVLYLNESGTRKRTVSTPDLPESGITPASRGVSASASSSLRPFTAFTDWAQGYIAATAAAKTHLEERGLELARQRRKTMADLIETDPERAFDVAIPNSLRKQLPAAIASLLEERVSAYGDYKVLAAISLPGQSLGVPPIQRSINVHGKEYKAFVYGHRVDAPSKSRLPVHGIALDDRIALHESAVQLLEPEERAAISPPAEQFCGVANTPLRDESLPVKVGSDIVWLCRDAHMAELREKLQDQAHRLAAAGGAGSVEGDTEESPYTEGRKRVIMFRVAFSNLPTPDISAESLTNVHEAVDIYWRINSFGKTSLAELGQGSDIVLVTLSTNYQYYNDRAGPFRDDVRAAATAQGIDLSKYDFDIVYSGGGRPSFSFGGLGFVGGPGSWVVGASRGISCHELGHNLGFPHANFWDTGGQSAIGPGGNQEYGDPFDVMGSGGVGDGTGGGHYVSKFKWRIGWMLDADFPRLLAASNTVRIYAHDNPDSRGIRGVRFRRDASMDYFLEFRQRFTGNRWLMNGIGLRWGSASGSSSQLIDTTPGTSDGKNDSPIVIGRTFSDANAGVHVTPLGLANTYPPSIDVRVNIGAFVGNQPPRLSLAASSRATGIGGAVTFTANASDPNNDEVAYAWDFGDGTLTATNTAVIEYAWTTAGEYKVRCVVTDMKGGTASESLIITVGAPQSFVISGRVLYRGMPLPNVFVRATSSRFAYSDSDGSYSITRLAAGNYAVTALLHPHTFLNPFFSNPVAVGPADATGIDFIAVDAPQNDVMLMPNGANWRYLDTGTDPGATWMTTEFNDSAWPSGAAQLGYGDGDESTVLSFGPDSNNKYPAYYFRRTFNVPNPAALTNFMLSFLRDDGGIVYLNGVEILRDNMPAGTVTYTTYAAENGEDTTLAPIDASLFVPGINVLAAEVHQVNGSSSDLSFDISVFATSVTNFSNLHAFYISQPGNNAAFTSPTTINIGVNAASTDDSYSSVEFFSDGLKIGEDSEAPFSFLWDDAPNGPHRLTAVSMMASGARMTSAPVNITVAVPALTQTLIESNAVWRYNDENTDLGAAWRATDYSDNTWSNGPAPLGYGDAGMATTLRNGRITYYFRHGFEIDDAALVTNLIARLLRDDGAVIYVNGQEAARVSMPPGTITFSSFASQTLDGADESIPVLLNIPPALLQDGPNTVAVEVHQIGIGSSDLRMGLELTAQLSALAAPGVRITSPGAISNTLPDTLPITATAVGDSILRVEFYRNDTFIGEDATLPYAIDWSEPVVGSSTLTAVAYESAGGAYTSTPVVVTFTAPQIGRELISPRSLWRYFDEGDPGVSWHQRLYNDSGWSQGYARLGYGGDGETTVVGFGSDPAKKHITTYFRHAFFLTNPFGINAFRLSLSRDDAAVVYLNGGEIFRNNLPPGPMSSTLFALASVSEPTDETNFITVTMPATRLTVGTNVIAVEVHQDVLESPDLGFDLALVALSNTNTVEGVYLTQPSQGARITLPAAVGLEAYAFASNAAVTTVEFFADGNKVAEAATFPYEGTWLGAPVGSHTLTAVAHFGSGNQLTSPPVQITVQGPPIMISQVVNTLFPFGSQWKYWNNPVAPPIDWTTPSYADAEWPSGNARFGFGLDGEATTLPIGRLAYYFRRTFNISNPALVEALIFQLRRDDGAVVYINGVEAYRNNMPAGAVTSTTLASADAVGLDEQQAFITTVTGPGLVPGVNVIAVEVHQSSPGSSDVGFDLHLTASGDTSPRVVLSRPGNGQAFVLPATVDLEAAAWPGQGRQVTKVEFYTNGVRLNEDTMAPYTFQWPDVPQGNYTLFARMTDNFGDVRQSGNATISVGHQLIRTNFIAAGSVWSYRDIGSNEGTAFAQFTYNDAAWGNGPAQLGYGDDDEATVVSFGPNSGAKYITTYFRHEFQSPSAWTITNITFRLLRDDGAVVWLNGREQFRSNMPGGAITYTTAASSAVDGANEDTYFQSSFTITNLPLNNLVAVELHQSSGTSSDISFDLEVIGTGYVAPTVRPTLSIARLAGGSVRLTWPASQTGWTLYSSANVTGGWTPSSHPVVISDGLHTVTIAHSETGAFYKLQKP